VVTWLLIYQRLHNNASLNDAVSYFVLEFLAEAWPDCKRCRECRLSVNTGAYSLARSNLPATVLEVTASRVFETLVDAYPPSWRDRRVFILDGTTLSLVATEELTAAFPPGSNQHGPAYWPVMHMVVAHELASGLAASPAYDAMYGPQASFLSEMFSARVRYSGASLGYQLASIFAGGLSPLVATWLLSKGVEAGKGPTFIAYYMIALVAITVIAVYFAKETHKDGIEE